MIYVLTFILAFCSIVYELLLGQTLSAFLGNTVLRYSVTIGLYMLCMGVGALIATERLTRKPVLSLQVVELLLAIIGGYSLFLMFMVDAGLGRTFWVSFTGHSLICIIGVLTGLEIPLLMAIKNRKAPEAETGVLGIDYIGAFVGTLAFAFYFYPTVGLTHSAFVVATANAVVGVLLITQWRGVAKEHTKMFLSLLVGQALVLLSLLYCVNNSATINEYFLALYLGTN